MLQANLQFNAKAICLSCISLGDKQYRGPLCLFSIGTLQRQWDYSDSVAPYFAKWLSSFNNLHYRTGRKQVAAMAGSEELLKEVVI